MSEKITVKTLDGRICEIYVIMTFQVENYPDDYIAYTFGETNNDNVEAYISKMKKNDNTITLDSIYDANEWENVNNALNNLLENGGEFGC